MYKNRPTPWFANPPIPQTITKVIIIGAGISGASTAYSLALRGYKVVVYEKNPQVAMEASGNYQAILYGTFSSENNPIQELSILGYNYSLNLIHKLLSKNIDYGISGLCDLSYNQIKLDKHYKLLNAKHRFIKEISQPILNKLSGANINCEHAVWYPDSVWIKPQNFINTLLDHHNINVICNTHITKIEQNTDTLNWFLFDRYNNLIDDTTCLILCNAHAISEFDQTKYLPLRKIRGQISIIPGDIGLKSIICSDTYVTPSIDGYFCCGATFKFNDNDLSIRNSEHHENISKMGIYLPELSQYIKTINLNHIIGQANFRTSTTDYLPLVGSIAKYHEFITDYKKLELDSNYWIETPCQYHQGLFLNIAHGAKGFLTAPICGEILASQINQQQVVSSSLIQAMHPNRLWLKQIIKHTIATQFA